MDWVCEDGGCFGVVMGYDGLCIFVLLVLVFRWF